MEKEKGKGCVPHPNWFFEMSRAFGRLLELDVKMLNLVGEVSKECAEVSAAVAKMTGFGVAIYESKESFPETGDDKTVYVSRGGGVYVWDADGGYTAV